MHTTLKKKSMHSPWPQICHRSHIFSPHLFPNGYLFYSLVDKTYVLTLNSLLWKLSLEDNIPLFLVTKCTCEMCLHQNYFAYMQCVHTRVSQTIMIQINVLFFILNLTLFVQLQPNCTIKVGYKMMLWQWNMASHVQFHWSSYRAGANVRLYNKMMYYNIKNIAIFSNTSYVKYIHLYLAKKEKKDEYSKCEYNLIQLEIIRENLIGHNESSILNWK